MITSVLFANRSLRAERLQVSLRMLQPSDLHRHILTRHIIAPVRFQMTFNVLHPSDRLPSASSSFVAACSASHMFL